MQDKYIPAVDFVDKLELRFASLAGLYCCRPLDALINQSFFRRGIGNHMKYPSVVILTGAGISAESGIQTFRGSDGLWENHRIEDVATPEAFIRNPALVQRFYNERRRQLLSNKIAPNPAHAAIGKLEREYSGKVWVVTQNIDNLHERGGTRNLIHMHGEMLKMFCEHCWERFDIAGDISSGDQCTACGRAGGLRPDIVWFGEMPHQMEFISELLEHCDLFVAIGTSGNVYPAAGFVQRAGRAGATTVELNLEPSQVENDFITHRYGPASKLVPVLIDDIMSGEVISGANL